jgi:hypothetical protein
MPEAQTETPEAHSARRDSLFALVVLGCVLVFLTMLSWRRWADMLIDFGLQLYIPWRISGGAVLYRDLAYMTGGPLSQYFDAFLFRVFGVSLLTLVLANLALLALLLALVYRCFYEAADQLTALVCCLAILLAFAFGQYSDYGVFSYVTPYCEEIYHGLILSIAAVALLAKWTATRRSSAALAAGFCCGLVFLTKPEVFVAAAAAVLASLILAWRVTGRSSAAFKGLGLMVLSGSVPLLAFLAYFLRFANFQQSLRWTCGAWAPMLNGAVSKSPFYKWCMGLQNPGPAPHLYRMFGNYLVLALIVWLCALVFRRRGQTRRDAFVFLLTAAPLAWLSWQYDWVEGVHCLPLVCLTMLALLVWRAGKAGWNPSFVFMALWTVFSLVLLAKLGLWPRLWHYGFVLAMPAFLTGICLLVHLAPALLQRFGVAANWWRALACILLLTGCLQLILFSKFNYQKRTVQVAEGADMLYTIRPEVDANGILKGDAHSANGAIMGAALSWMEANTSSNSTMAVIPAGVMLNYMLRRPNPTPYLRWNPPEMAVYGQSNMIRAVEQSKPDYILLVGMDTSEFGVDYFGDTESFGRELVQWIHRAYQPVCLVGHDWNKDHQFGIEVFKRIP